jgi:hypothetical protein
MRMNTEDHNYQKAKKRVKESGTIALLTGKYKARGQISLLMKMDRLFTI